MGLRDRIYADFLSLLNDDDVRSFNINIKYVSVRKSTYNAVTGQYIENKTTFNIKAIQTLYKTEKKEVNKSTIEQGDIVFYISVYDLTVTPNILDYINYNNIIYYVTGWQLDTDANVYRIITNTRGAGD